MSSTTFPWYKIRVFSFVGRCWKVRSGRQVPGAIVPVHLPGRALGGLPSNISRPKLKVLSSACSALPRTQLHDRNLVATNLFATQPTSCIAKAGTRGEGVAKSLVVK